MSVNSIIILDGGIEISKFNVPRREVADFLRSVDEEERSSALTRAIEVGVFCLERARATQDIEFVRRQVEFLLNKVQEAVGAIPAQTQRALIEKIGASEGQVLAPISTLLREVSQATNTRLNDVRSLLAQDLDPSKDTSTIGMALRKLRDLLDPQRNDSIQSSLNEALRSVTAENGPLANSVKAVVAGAVKPLEDEVKDLAREIRGDDAAAEALQQTIEKGDSYEDLVLREVHNWAKFVGAEEHHVGGDNQPGDILVRLASTSLLSTPLSIVIEARDRQSPVGRKAISDSLSRAMVARNSTAAIYVSRKVEGLGKEIGDWAEGATERGPFVACTHTNLATALRFLLVHQRMTELQASVPEVDSAQVETQIQRIRTSLARVKGINRKASDVRGSAQEIQNEAELLRDEIRDALSCIEDVLRKANHAASQGANHALAS